MTMDSKKFKENMLVHGADVNQWPEEIRQAGLEALESSPELQALSADQEHFERILKTRKYEEPGVDLAQRIITASLHQKKKSFFSLGSLLSGVLGELRLPKPALTAVYVLMIFVLMIGFGIGFSDPMGSALAEQEQINLQEFLYDEGEVL